MQTPSPTEDELRKAYSVDYAPYHPAWREKGWPLWRILRELTTRRRVARLKRYAKGHRLLEVGSGAGDFLYAVHRRGWDVKAVEYSEKSAESLRSELGLDARAGEFRRGLWKEAEFDVVVLWSVLEHVGNPLDTLVTACSYLRVGGLLFLQIPTQYGIERGMWFGQYWALLDLPRHLNFFSKESLARLCDHAGMDLVVFKTPALETAWCYVASSCNIVSRAERPAQMLARSLEVVVRATLDLPTLVFQAWRERGTEAFAIAMKRNK